MAAPRKFDHDEARRLRAEGMTYTVISQRMGVSDKAVARACDPAARRRMTEATAQWIKRKREPCRGGCGRLVWTHRKVFSGYCPTCLGERRRAENGGPHHGTEAEYTKRKCRCEACRLASTEAKRRRRAARAVPCKNCGKLRMNTKDINPRGYEDSGLCRDCYHARRRAAA